MNGEHPDDDSDDACGDCRSCLNLNDGKCHDINANNHKTEELCIAHDSHLWCQSHDNEDEDRDEEAAEDTTSDEEAAEDNKLVFLDEEAEEDSELGVDAMGESQKTSTKNRKRFVQTLGDITDDPGDGGGGGGGDGAPWFGPPGGGGGGDGAPRDGPPGGGWRDGPPRDA